MTHHHRECRNMDRWCVVPRSGKSKNQTEWRLLYHTWRRSRRKYFLRKPLYIRASSRNRVHARYHWFDSLYWGWWYGGEIFCCWVWQAPYISYSVTEIFDCSCYNYRKIPERFLYDSRKAGIYSEYKGRNQEYSYTCKRRLRSYESHDHLPNRRSWENKTLKRGESRIWYYCSLAFKLII